MRLKKGILIVFEGIDGSGKTTQAKLLYNHLKIKGFNAVFSKEPTDSVFGERIRRLAAGDRAHVDPVEEYRLFFNDRKIHVDHVIKPALEKRKIVILDRYYFSTMAYQGSLGLDPQKIKHENEVFAPVPDIVFLIRVPVSLGLERIKMSRNEVPNLFEREEGLTKVEYMFESFAEEYILSIDGTGDVDAIHKNIVKVTEEMIRTRLLEDEK